MHSEKSGCCCCFIFFGYIQHEYFHLVMHPWIFRVDVDSVNSVLHIAPMFLQLRISDCPVSLIFKAVQHRLFVCTSPPHPYHPEAPHHHYGIIVCAMRFFLPVFSPYYEAFWEVHKGEDPHRVFGLCEFKSVDLVTAV